MSTKPVFTNNQIFSLKRVFLSKITKTIFQKKFSDKFSSFPKQIGIYYFKKTMFNNRTHRPFQFALYVNKKGQKAIAKRWMGKEKNFDYYSLINEMRIYKELEILYKNHGHKIIEKYPEIKLPKLIETLNEEQMAILLIEFIEYNSIGNINVNKKIKIYERLIDYLRFIGELIPKEHADLIAKRTLISAILLAPFISLRAIIKHPKITLDILKGLILFISIAPLLIKEKNVTFLHKSLEDHNILSDGKNIYLIDFQLSVLAHPTFELSQTILFSWHDSNFIEKFYKSKIMKNTLKDPISLNVYKALCIYSGIIEVAFGGKAEFEDCSSFLKHALSIKKGAVDINTIRLDKTYDTKFLNHKKTLSVGIPVHNEAANINSLLESILRQNQVSYVLEKIIVVCDGTTDGTDNKVLEMAKKNPLISLVNDGKRKGKVERLMEIYKMNESDVVFVFDGDVVLSTSGVMENMVKLFDKKEIAVVGGNAQPTPAISFVEKLINKWFYIWYLARSGYNDGDSVHNISGCALGLKKYFAKNIVFPKYLISEAHYIYFYALSKHAEFRFAKDAVVLFQSPQTLNDYLLQTRRSTPFTPKLSSIFGDYILKKYRIPIKYKTGAILTMIIKDPIFTAASAGFYFLSLILPYKNTGGKKGVRFKSVESTKKAIITVVK